jgi:protein-tyrosine phosphatase
VPIVRVSVRDFDRLDQAKMLPEMVRKLACFRAMGKRTYVHCTAGINRASLTVLGHLTFVVGLGTLTLGYFAVKTRFNL